MTLRSGDTPTQFLYNGRYGVMTDASDLYYMRARYYNPVAQRFLSPDTLTGQITKPQSQNLYAFCESNPVNNVDPTGYDVGCAELDSPYSGRVIIPELGIDWEYYEQLYQQDRYDEIPEPVMNEIGGLQPDPVGEFLFIDLPSGGLAGAVRGFIFKGGTTLFESIDTYLANEVGSIGTGQIHHIASDKAIASGFTEKFKSIFEKAGMSLQAKENRFLLLGHAGRHSLKYRNYVLMKLQTATEGLSGNEYKEALLKELEFLKTEIIAKPNIVKGVDLP